MGRKKTNETMDIFQNAIFGNGSMKQVVAIIFLLLLFYSAYLDGNDFTSQQMRHPIKFNDVDEKSTFQLVATAYHVYLKINIRDDGPFFTIGVATLPKCEGVFLTAPDLNASRYKWIPPTESTIKGKCNKKQADYIKKCMNEEPATECHSMPDNAYKENEDLFHVHRLKNSYGDFCVYKMLRPKNPIDTRLEKDINCGTWLTHFIQMGDNPDAIAEWYLDHVLYMKPGFI